VGSKRKYTAVFRAKYFEHKKDAPAGLHSGVGSFLVDTGQISYMYEYIFISAMNI